MSATIEKRNKTTANKNQEDYNELPYTSHPFHFTRPEYLNNIAHLFNVPAPSIEKARILELGCASGGNIINFAANYPNSYTLGIDFSHKEIEEGKKNIGALKLKNIELKCLSILDLEETLTKFDYIICHGVFSWVPVDVQDKIFSICKNLLSPTGVAIVTYNTLPGWNMVNTIREMKLFHSEIFSNVQDKIQQSRLFLKFISDALSESTSPYAKFLKEESAMLEHKEDNYIRHEYLAQENEPIYFHQFIEKARKNNLNYLGEANIHTMYAGNLPPKVAEKFQAINDIIRTEQYMDFITNRRFRCTLLCHDNIQIKRDLNNNAADDFYITCNLRPSKPLSQIDLNDSTQKAEFIYDGSKVALDTTNPSLKAILYTLTENIGNPLKINEIAELAHSKLPQYPLAEYVENLKNNVLKLIFSGYIKLFSVKPKAIAVISDTPVTSELVKLQIAQNILKGTSNKSFWVTNQINELLFLNPYEVVVLSNLTGKNDIKQLSNIIIENFRSGKLIASINNEVIKDEERFTAIANEALKNSLEKFRTNYLLIA